MSIWHQETLLPNLEQKKKSKSERKSQGFNKEANKKDWMVEFRRSITSWESNIRAGEVKMNVFMGTDRSESQLSP